MGECTGGIWFWLRAAALYSLFQNLLGARRARRVLIAEYIRPNGGDQILDVGCGPADILDFLPPDVRYVGVDHSRTYIEAARRCKQEAPTASLMTVLEIVKVWKLSKEGPDAGASGRKRLPERYGSSWH